MGLFGIQWNSTQEWTSTNYDYERSLMYDRVNYGDHYPEGIDTCNRIIDRARDEHKVLKIIAMKTLPKWTWYFKVVE